MNSSGTTAGFWSQGVSFIGSHLVDLLTRYGAYVPIVNDMSSVSVENIRHHLSDRRGELIEADLQPGVVRQTIDQREVVFHLAADLDWVMLSPTKSDLPSTLRSVVFGMWRLPTG